MLPNGIGARMIGVALIALVVATAVVFFGQPSGSGVAALRSSAAERVEHAERERQAAAVRSEAVAARAATARAATRPLVARADSLRARVRVVASGQLQVDSSDVIRVPPPVTDRLQTDSVAISALTVALAWDASAAAAQDERLAAEAKARDAASLRIAQLERERSPRCGRRCGFVLGAASIVALGIAAGQTRRLLHQ
jgi:hypothetical protein